MKKTADEICAMDDRPEFPVEIPEWDLVGENSAIVKQPDVFTIATIETSCDNSPEGRARRSARLIIEGCVSPKFTLQHEESLMKAKSPVAIGRLVDAIFNGKKRPVRKFTDEQAQGFLDKTKLLEAKLVELGLQMPRPAQ